MTDLATLELDLINAIGAAESVAAIEEVRVAALGKTGKTRDSGRHGARPDQRRRPNHHHRPAPPTIMGTHSHWPMLMPSASRPSRFHPSWRTPL